MNREKPISDFCVGEECPYCRGLGQAFELGQSCCGNGTIHGCCGEPVQVEQTVPCEGCNGTGFIKSAAPTPAVTDKAEVEKLEEAIRWTQAAISTGMMTEVNIAQRIVDAARAHLETLRGK